MSPNEIAPVILHLRSIEWVLNHIGLALWVIAGLLAGILWRVW
jgi:hypothetical protein